MGEVTWTGDAAYIGRRKVGYIKDDTFKSPRNRGKHLFRKYNGFSISAQLLDEVNQRGINKVQLSVKEPDGNITELLAYLHTWYQRGIPYQHRDFEPQLILGLGWFETV